MIKTGGSQAKLSDMIKNPDKLFYMIDIIRKIDTLYDEEHISIVNILTILIENNEDYYEQYLKELNDYEIQNLENDSETLEDFNVFFFNKYINIIYTNINKPIDIISANFDYTKILSLSCNYKTSILHP